jgi:hypothetical protein
MEKTLGLENLNKFQIVYQSYKKTRTSQEVIEEVKVGSE